MAKDPVFLLCDAVRETAFAAHRYLGPGYLEKIYEEALTHRLRKRGLTVERQIPFTVYDEDGTALGEFFADLMIEKTLLLELKSVSRLADEHTAQLLGYLRATTIEHGLLINFGGSKFEIRKFAMSHRGESTESEL